MWKTSHQCQGYSGKASQKVNGCSPKTLPVICYQVLWDDTPDTFRMKRFLLPFPRWQNPLLEEFNSTFKLLRHIESMNMSLVTVSKTLPTFWVTQYTIEIKLEAKALLNNAFFLWNPCWSHVKWNKSEMNDFKTRLDIFGRVFTSLKLLKRHKEQTSWFRILSKFNGTCCFVAPVVAVIFQTPWKFAEVERRLK